MPQQTAPSGCYPACMGATYCMLAEITLMGGSNARILYWGEDDLHMSLFLACRVFYPLRKCFERLRVGARMVIILLRELSSHKSLSMFQETVVSNIERLTRGFLSD